MLPAGSASGRMWVSAVCMGAWVQAPSTKAMPDIAIPIDFIIEAPLFGNAERTEGNMSASISDQPKNMI